MLLNIYHLKLVNIYLYIHTSNQDRDDNKPIMLPQASGGKSLQVHIGQQSTSSVDPLSHTEILKMSTRAGLSGEQQASVVADIRAKFGHKVVKSGLQKAVPVHNNQLASFFTVEEKMFVNSEDQLVPKFLFFCEDIRSFLSYIADKRGVSSEDIEHLVQGDSGQQYFKLIVNMIKKEHLKQESGVRLPSAGFHFEENCETGPLKKRIKRRFREDGIGGGLEFKEWGARKSLILAVAHNMPENHHNLKIIFDATKLYQIPFKLTGDFALIMPILGLIKGCGSCNPCPICDQERTKQGTNVLRWVEEKEISLRTLGGQYADYAGWVMDGEKISAAGTKKWRSVCGTPLLQMTEGRQYEDLVLSLIVPGPLHLFLSFNEIINFMEKTVWPEIKVTLENVAGVQVHLYMGKIGNYQGPEIHKIFRNLEKLQAHMESDNLVMYYNTFCAFKDVAHSLFGLVLQSDWREKLHLLKLWIERLKSTYGMPITPKLHILTTHIEQWVDLFGRSLGKEGEQPGESLHHLWRKLLENLGEPKKKNSKSFKSAILKSLLMFNANNI